LRRSRSSPPIPIKKHEQLAVIADPVIQDPIVGVLNATQAWRFEEYELAVGVYAGGYAQNGLDLFAGHTLFNLLHSRSVKRNLAWQQGRPQRDARQEHA